MKGKAKPRGGKYVTVRLLPDDFELLERLIEARGLEGYASGAKSTAAGVIRSLIRVAATTELGAK